MLKHKVDKDFTVVTNKIFKDKRLSIKAKGIWCQLVSLPDGWNFTIAGLAELSNDGRDSIRSGLKELVDNGWLEWKQVNDNGRFEGNEVTTKVPLSENLSTDSAHNKELRDKELKAFTKVNASPRRYVRRGDPKHQVIKHALDEAKIYYDTSNATKGKINSILKYCRDNSGYEHTETTKAVQLIRKAAAMAGKKDENGINFPVVSNVSEMAAKIKKVDIAKFKDNSGGTIIRESVH